MCKHFAAAATAYTLSASDADGGSRLIGVVDNMTNMQDF